MTTEQIMEAIQYRGETIAEAMQSGRWFMSAKDGRLTLQPVPLGAYVITAEEFASVIREPGRIPLNLLPEIVKAANSRMADYIGSGRDKPVEPA